jgi:FMN reductase
MKVFLDQFPTNGLDGVHAIPLMLGGGLAHALAPELLLKPVLVEMGATCPTPGLFLVDKTFAEDERVSAFVDKAKRLLPLDALGEGK